MRIVVLDGGCIGNNLAIWSELKQFGDVKVYNTTDDEEIYNRLEDADIVVSKRCRLRPEVVPKNVVFISLLATGIDRLDIAGLSKRNITISNIPDYCSTAVAEFTIALMLNITQKIGLYNEDVKAGRWINASVHDVKIHPTTEVCGKTLGILGTGHIGQKVAGFARALGMEVVAFSRSRRAEAQKIICYADSIEEVYRRSDIITLHLPLTKKTTGIINLSAIEKMKDGVILLNPSRGLLVDEEAVIKGLHSGKISAYGADALGIEPPNGNMGLLKEPNAFITPHIAWGSEESIERMVKETINNVQAFLSGQPIHVVNRLLEGDT